MSLAPRAVVVHRATEYEELVARHGTHGQAAFFLSSRGRSLDEVVERHHRARRALALVSAAVPMDWRRAQVERADLERFLFGPEDVVVAVGQDGLVANVAQYVGDRPVLGVDTDPGRNPGVLVRHRPEDVARLLPAAFSASVGGEELTMVEAVTDDTQRLVALNEIYVGAAGHRTARYRLGLDGDRGAVETQASSGVLIGTGTGASGWLRSVWQDRSTPVRLPHPTEERLAWFVREAWPSPATGTRLNAGELAAGARLSVTVESERLVAFGDGMESDALDLTWGQTIRLGLCPTKLRLIG
ncbi:hypothetical protein [Streptomyces sp. NPDC046939]|uniref:hypothetical protein n=1 Tax=Streptomyces sp. NPDC046939 TaxID=3155376 RepID=UPI0033CA7E3E